MITDHGEGRHTYTPDNFIPCDLDYSTEEYPEPCWFTGAALVLTYNVHGLDGRYVLHTCATHLPDALADLADPRRAPYTTHTVIKTNLADARDDAR